MENKIYVPRLLIESDVSEEKKQLDMDDVLMLPGGILISEGGMGKTTYLEALCEKGNDKCRVHLLKLREYIEDAQGLRDDIDDVVQTKEDVKTLFLFDGLNEAPELFFVVFRCLNNLNKKEFYVWFSTQAYADLEKVKEQLGNCGRSNAVYCLTPWGRDEICVFAQKHGENGAKFLFEVERKGLLPLCEKPLGCGLVLDLFSHGELTVKSQNSLWEQSISRLCDKTEQGIEKSPDISLSDIQCAVERIAVFLVLSNRYFIWTGLESQCPKNAVLSSLCISSECSLATIQKALTRGVFSHQSSQKVAFAHALVRDYCAAKGFVRFIPQKFWLSLLLAPKHDIVYPQHIGVASALASIDANFGKTLLNIQPELLISPFESIQCIGAGTLCEALFRHVDELTFEQRRQLNYHYLKSPETLKILRTNLEDSTSSDQAIEMAVSIVTACRYRKLVPLLIDIFVNKENSPKKRRTAGYGLLDVKNHEESHRVVARFEDCVADDLNDDFRGLALRICWPDSLSITQLLNKLTPPQKKNCYGAYFAFLFVELPRYLLNHLHERDVPQWLIWANTHLQTGHDARHGLGSLACVIYTLCWKFVSNSNVAKLLADGLLTSIVSMSSPILCTDAFSANFIPVDQLGVDRKRDVVGRMQVIDAALNNGNFAKHSVLHILRLCEICFVEDLPCLLRKASEASSEEIVSRWIALISNFLNETLIEKYQSEIDYIHTLYYTVIPSSNELLLKVRKVREEAEKMKATREQEEEGSLADAERDQYDMTEKIKAELKNSQIPCTLFPGIACAITMKNGQIEWYNVDIASTLIWSQLDLPQQEKLTDLAHQYLTQEEIPKTKTKKINYSVLRALTLLQCKGAPKFYSLTETDWNRFAIQLLENGSDPLVKKFRDPLLDRLSEEFPDVAMRALLAVVSREMKLGFLPVIQQWEARLTRQQAESILELARPVNKRSVNRYCLIANQIVRQQKQTEIVKKQLDDYFKKGWMCPKDATFHPLRTLAFQLNPLKYIPEVLAALQSEPLWSRNWLETACEEWYDEPSMKAVLSCTSMDLVKLFIWLEQQYPPENQPQHDQCFSPNAIDHVYDLKNLISGQLCDRGSLEDFEVLHETLPSQQWLVEYKMLARNKTVQSQLKGYSVKDIQKLCDKQNGDKFLVSSIQDLMATILECLKNYQRYLQSDTPAIGDLWNVIGPEYAPCNEEDFSDHIKRYLDLRLYKGTIINREVQIHRKMCKDGESGSKTDLWIQAVNPDSNVITLCIEVKGSWNKSATTAMETQLLNKYMSGGTATGGILLLGWFECTNCKKLKNIWKNTQIAEKSLNEQAKELKTKGHYVESFVIDCSLK